MVCNRCRGSGRADIASALLSIVIADGDPIALMAKLVSNFEAIFADELSERAQINSRQSDAASLPPSGVVYLLGGS
jgi:hypothetical protein